MDRSLLPEILSMTVFIVGFRPLARRVGAHADLWFLGWGLVLLNMVGSLFGASASKSIHLASEWALLAAALVFLLAAANIPKRRINWLVFAEMTLPLLSLAAADVYEVRRTVPLIAICLGFLVPGVHVWVSRCESGKRVAFVFGAFAVFGVAAIPVVLRSPHVAQQLSSAVVFLSAAYLYCCGAERHSRGVIAAAAGLAAWGLGFPFALALPYYFPGVVLDRSILYIPVYFVVTGIMLTLLEEHVERTERMAMHDPLTDLPNRRMFEERLIATMEEARINRTTVACLVIDVDNFKHINDTLGHNAGDQLLRALAVRLSWHMTPRDILARTGGDEFTALLAGVNDEHHLRFIAGAMMSAGSVPIMIDGKPVDLRISIGIALSPDHADDIDSLRRAADEAMYTAKRRGGSMLAFADEA